MKRLLPLFLLASCGPTYESHPYHAVDGDTIRVGVGPLIRLARIDAPELPGHCRPGRNCVEGDPDLPRWLLQRMLDQGELRCRDIERDVYDRRIAECWIDDTNLSDALLASGTVGLYQRSR